MSITPEDRPNEPADEQRKKLGERLREAREYLGFSQEDVAKSLDIPRSALSNMETGQRKVEAIELKKLASLYKRPLTFFAGAEESAEAEYGEEIAFLAKQVADLSSADKVELARFADFLRARKQPKEG